MNEIVMIAVGIIFISNCIVFPIVYHKIIKKESQSFGSVSKE